MRIRYAIFSSAFSWPAACRKLIGPACRAVAREIIELQRDVTPAPGTKDLPPQ